MIRKGLSVSFLAFGGKFPPDGEKVVKFLCGIHQHQKGLYIPKGPKFRFQNFVSKIFFRIFHPQWDRHSKVQTPPTSSPMEGKYPRLEVPGFEFEFRVWQLTLFSTVRCSL